jgi:hypothetical protein
VPVPFESCGARDEARLVIAQNRFVTRRECFDRAKARPRSQAHTVETPELRARRVGTTITG